MRTGLQQYSSELEIIVLEVGFGQITRAVFIERRKELLAQCIQKEKEEIEAAFEEGFFAGGAISQLGDLAEKYYEDNFGDKYKNIK